MINSLIKFKIVLISVILYCSYSHAQYKSDEFGNGLLCRTIDMPDDYEGKVVCTLIKRDCEQKSGKALLYVHGFNDYFFQTEMADRFNAEGYNFYAVDLRKYGRSLLPHQKRCNTRNINEYFADIDSAVNIIEREGNDTIILMGHSTGGLTTSLYCHSKGDACPVDALILNSPFFKFNMGDVLNDVAIPLVSFIAPLLPNISIPQGASTAYAESLLINHHGEWVFDTDKKLMLSPDVTTGWIGAIYDAQNQVWRGLDIKVPILSMYSDNSVNGDEWDEEFMHGDAVLNVDDIAKYSQTLGDNVKRLKVVGGMHDLICSQPDVRNRVYKSIFTWLSAISC
ncbi:MAG: alpha/beta hydrolase [Bacteroidales bacterium]|nr:alpha/beta hydrolase [Bacteroidales bacterium]